MIDFNKYLCTCRSPTLVQRINRESKIFPCGRCPECSNRKSVYKTNLLIKQSMISKYCYFVTLKYDEYNVPRMKLVEDIDNGITCIDITSRLLKNGNFRYSPTYGQILQRLDNCNFQDDTFKEFYKRADITSKVYDNSLPYKTLRYLSKTDLQKFIKRFRFYASQTITDYELSNFKYYAVGEYGPKTFRPHFHILFFFDSPQFFVHCRDIIYKAWKFGSIDFQLARNKNGVASYVASYLNSDVALPYFLSGSKIRPFSVHSCNFASEVDEEIRDTIYKIDRYSFEPFDLQTSKGISTFIFDSHNSHKLFPRCYNYDNITRSDMVKLYGLYYRLTQDWSADDRASTLTYNFIFQSHKYRDILKLLDITLEPKARKETDIGLYLRPQNFVNYNLSRVYSDDPIELDDYDIRIYHRIYSAVLMSKNFIKFNCQNVPFEKMITKVIDYYIQRDYNNLTLQLSFQEQYASEGHQDFRIFYPNYYLKEYIELVENDNYLKALKTYHDEQYSKKIKHKELNDLNQIFL